MATDYPISSLQTFLFGHGVIEEHKGVATEHDVTG